MPYLLDAMIFHGSHASLKSTLYQFLSPRLYSSFRVYQLSNTMARASFVYSCMYNPNSKKKKRKEKKTPKNLKPQSRLTLLGAKACQTRKSTKSMLLLPSSQTPELLRFNRLKLSPNANPNKRRPTREKKKKKKH